MGPPPRQEAVERNRGGDEDEDTKTQTKEKRHDAKPGGRLRRGGDCRKGRERLKTLGGREMWELLFFLERERLKLLL